MSISLTIVSAFEFKGFLKSKNYVVTNLNTFNSINKSINLFLVALHIHFL